MADFIEEYACYCRAVTDAPAVYHEFMALGTLAASIGGKIFCRYGASKLKPNLYMVLLGSSSVFRKSTCLSISRRLVSSAQRFIYPNEFSTERLYEELAANPQGSFYFSEFASLTGLLARDYMMGCKAFLTSLYDCEPLYTRKLKSGEVAIKEPCVNVFSASTVDWFLERAKEGDLAGGFLPRFIFVTARDKTEYMAFPPPCDEQKEKHLVNWLKAAGEIEGEAIFGKGARAIYESWQRSHQKKTSNPLLSGFAARLEVCALKFAMLQNAANEMSLEITEKSVHDACLRIDFLSEALRRLEEEEFAFSKDERDRNKVLKAVRRVKNIARGELLRATRLSSGDLDRAVTTLIEAEQITVEQFRGPAADKPTRLYRIAGAQAGA